ncbi:replication-relaxation family protein [Paenibacillus sp. S150]|uniref:replication-relaxation family protein n=1 Tax=Paenibacillus sp. S150 TaxID=2749826 RepID=UPI001C56C62B|nr:replication-relaxation family protein [Paenibacillus sp. S150]MBW4081283.1 replication-relaxation family protein [Paenibacillus sp. S150]
MYYEAKKETLVMLYRHTLLTAGQLAILLHYKPKTMYNIAVELREKGLLRSVLLPFLKRNHVGYTLTAYGARAAASLAGDETVFRSKGWEDGPVQLEHYYGTNAFFADVIRYSLPREGEGLIEWLDPRAAAERYVQPRKGRKPSALVRPDGFGMYVLPGRGRLAFHLEYDTGTETLWRLKEKMLQYGDLLPVIWPRVEAVHVLFLTRGQNRTRMLMDIWEALAKGSFTRETLPCMWVINEQEWKEQGVGEALWQGSGGQQLRLLDMPLLPPLPDAIPILGRQPREQPPMERK